MYEELMTVDSNATSGQVPVADGNGSFAWSNASTFGYVAKSGDTMTGDLTLPNLTASGNAGIAGKVTVGGHAVMTYNSTTQSLDFSFV